MKFFSSCFSVVLVMMTCFLTCRTASPELARNETKKADGWHVYTAPDRSFSVEVPCEPVQRNVSAPSTPTYEYSCGVEDDSGLSFFIVSVLDLRDAEKARMRDETAVERSVKDSFSPNKRVAKLIPLKIENGIGREFVVINTKDEMDNLRGRAIIFGSRRYDVGFVSSAVKALESPMADRFLSTFKPLE
jgi:hypothetical protein